MSEPRPADVASPRVANMTGVMAALIVLNVLFSIVANAAFRLSAGGATWSDVLTWQVIGNLAGFITVLALTGLLRYLPLAVAFPVTTGMSIIGVQLVAARWLFNEPIDATQWAGSLLIVAGIFLVQR